MTKTIKSYLIANVEIYNLYKVRLCIRPRLIIQRNYPVFNCDSHVNIKLNECVVHSSQINLYSKYLYNILYIYVSVIERCYIKTKS